MVTVDMTHDPRPKPGIHLATVKHAQLKLSRNGENMIAIELVDHRGVYLCMDHIMLEGGGWGIGRDKLTGLGIPDDFSGDLDPLNLRGIKVWIALAERSYTDRQSGEKKSALGVDREQLKLSGYQKEKDVPEGCEVPKDEAPEEETPFG